MSKNSTCNMLSKMHCKLDSLIEKNNYNLMSSEVQTYSKKLDKALSHYNMMLKKKKQSS